MGKYKTNSIYSLFNKVQTMGGERLLDSMFRFPLSNAEEINKRSEVFQYFERKNFIFPFSRERYNVVENYLSSEGGGNIVVAFTRTFRRKFLNYIGLDQEYKLVKEGLLSSIELLNILQDFLFKLQEQDPENPYHSQIEILRKIFESKWLRWLPKERGVLKLPLIKMAKYDYLLKHALQEEMKEIFQVIYNLDVCIAVSNVSRARGFSYAEALPAERNCLQIEELYHPSLDNAVANSVSIGEDSNVIFLTGANMAGKSTFMKSFGISVYLAHMGFPIAAKGMTFSVKDGIYSSINISDNLGLGISHFYAEVLRVKEVAVAVAESKNLVILFDELFKGTNVKDAYDATLAVSEAFAENRNCLFIISTHIIEVGITLRERCDNLRFVYFPTVMKNKVPKYTYMLEEGITSDRHGMIIIENEKILEIILGNKVGAK
ncbi:MAG: DNA mismatch repair protein [Ginsengibacter sp.]